MWSVECGGWNVECGVWSVECGVVLTLRNIWFSAVSSETDISASQTIN